MEQETADNGPERFRVMRIISRMNIGGPAVHVVLLNAGLDPQTYDCLLVTDSEGASEGSLRDLAEVNHLRLAVIPQLGREISPRSDLLTRFALYRLMRRERPHFMERRTARVGLSRRIAARLAGISVVLHTFHGRVSHAYLSPRKTCLFHLIERLGARLGMRIITVTISPRLREEIAYFEPIRSERLEVMPLYSDIESFALRPGATGDFRRSFNVSADSKPVAAVRPLVPITNTPLLLEAAALPRQQNPAIRVITDDDELREESQARAEALNPRGAIVFADWRRDPLRVHADLDVVVVSSDNDRTPASLIEDMATRCPVVASRVGGVCDLIANAKTGRLVPSGERQAPARSALTLFQEPVRTSQIASLVGRRVLERPQAKCLGADAGRLYRELLSIAGG